MIADLIHHIRAELSIDQLSRIVHEYSCHVHDATLPFAIQNMCSKLLLNLIGNIMAKEQTAAAGVLYRILETFVRKIESLAEFQKDWAKWARPRASGSSSTSASPAPTTGEEGQAEEMDDVDVERMRPVSMALSISEPGPEAMKGSTGFSRVL